MQSVFPAETAILIHFKPVRIVFLVFLGIVISLLALAANQCDLNSQFRHLLINLTEAVRPPLKILPPSNEEHNFARSRLFRTTKKPSPQR